MRAPWYSLENVREVASPALLVYPERIRRNLERMLDRVGGDPRRLRLHVKTHKMAEVVDLCRSVGLERFKCATLAEAEMLGQCGAEEALLAFPVVGPNLERLRHLVRAYPRTRFSTLVDHRAAAEALSAAFAGSPLEAWIDLDCGMHRTGAAPEEAAPLARVLRALPGVRLAGLHAYDGHIHESDLAARRGRFIAAMEPVFALKRRLEAECGPLRLVSGGTPTFPFHAAHPEAECSPGTPVLWDFGYQQQYPDLEFDLAAALLARVVARPGGNRLCLDLGYKAVASENPHPRVLFPGIPDAVAVLHSEEHLVIETSRASAFEPGDPVFGIPRHICPTCALYSEAVVVSAGRAAGTWPIVARGRKITV